VALAGEEFHSHDDDQKRDNREHQEEHGGQA
jgi:hypothetical protein